LIFSTYTTYFLRITSPMNLLDRSFLKQFKTFAVRVLSDLKILCFASYLYISNDFFKFAWMHPCHCIFVFQWLLTWRGRFHIYHVYLCCNYFLTWRGRVHIYTMYICVTMTFQLGMDASMSFVMCFTYLYSNDFLTCQYCCFWNGYMDLFWN
jgi:hypothetical protein